MPRFGKKPESKRLADCTEKPEGVSYSMFEVALSEFIAYVRSTGFDGSIRNLDQGVVLEYLKSQQPLMSQPELDLHRRSISAVTGQDV